MTAMECKDQIRAAIKKIHPEGWTCNNGYDESCHACHEAQLPILRAFAADKPVIQSDFDDGKEGNDAFYIYWKRIGGPFYDEWVTVAQERIRTYKQIGGNQEVGK
jgi:hypothetical protein